MNSCLTEIAFLTYDKDLHFYKLGPLQKSPQMMVVTELEPIFMPVEDELMVNISDSYDLIINLLENLPNYFLNATR
jgi:protein transport protein SEC24